MSENYVQHQFIGNCGSASLQRLPARAQKKRAWKTQARWRRKNSGKTGVALLLA
jgi:hypothetical protein